MMEDTGLQQEVPCGEYEPPDSLWKLITAYIVASEWEEVKLMLGADVVEQSIELHQEVETLLEIWREYREETESAQPQQPRRLPEPPVARDRLKQEIQFFVLSLQEKAKENGRDPRLILSRHNSAVIDYALDSGYNSSSRPSTGRSSGCNTPLRAPDSARSSSHVRISMKEELDAMNDKLSVYKINTVVAHLQQAMQEEVDTLLADTEFLQHCLDDEADIRCQSSMSISREPSLADMRDERSKLEKELLTPDSLLQDTGKLPPRREASSLIPKSLGSIRPGSSSSAKSLAPLKASHSIQPSKMHIHTSSSSSSSSSSTTAAAPHRPSVRRAGQFSQRMSSAKLSSTASASSAVVPSSSSSSSSSFRRGTSMDALARNLSHVTVKTTPPAKKPDINGDGGGGVDRGGTGEMIVDSDVKVNLAGLVPSPPKNAKPKSGTQRPRSAQRFRQMVMGCRDGT